jgi:hypothetical protein
MSIHLIHFINDQLEDYFNSSANLSDNLSRLLEALAKELEDIWFQRDSSNTRWKGKNQLQPLPLHAEMLTAFKELAIHIRTVAKRETLENSPFISLVKDLVLYSTYYYEEKTESIMSERNFRYCG